MGRHGSLEIGSVPRVMVFKIPLWWGSEMNGGLDKKVPSWFAIDAIGGYVKIGFCSEDQIETNCAAELRLQP